MGKLFKSVLSVYILNKHHFQLFLVYLMLKPKMCMRMNHSMVGWSSRSKFVLDVHTAWGSHSIFFICLFFKTVSPCVAMDSGLLPKSRTEGRH